MDPHPSAAEGQQRPSAVPAGVGRSSPRGKNNYLPARPDTRQLLARTAPHVIYTRVPPRGGFADLSSHGRLLQPARAQVRLIGHGRPRPRGGRLPLLSPPLTHRNDHCTLTELVAAGLEPHPSIRTTHRPQSWRWVNVLVRPREPTGCGCRNLVRSRTTPRPCNHCLPPATPGNRHAFRARVPPAAAVGWPAHRLARRRCGRRANTSRIRCYPAVLAAHSSK